MRTLTEAFIVVAVLMFRYRVPTERGDAYSIRRDLFGYKDKEIAQYELD